MRHLQMTPFPFLQAILRDRARSLPGFPVQRDLIADIDQMLDQIRKLKPYLQANNELATTKDGKINAFEYLQNPQQLAKYELLTNCIACGTCEGSCPVYAGRRGVHRSSGVDYRVSLHQ